MTIAARDLRQRATPSEQLLWEHLRDRRFRGLKFRRQQPIGGRFILDFYCAELHLAIEVDGAIHGHQLQDDLDRQRALEVEGIRVIRLRVDQLVGDIATVLSEAIPDSMTPPLHNGGEGAGG